MAGTLSNIVGDGSSKRMYRKGNVVRISGPLIPLDVGNSALCVAWDTPDSTYICMYEYVVGQCQRHKEASQSQSQSRLLAAPSTTKWNELKWNQRHPSASEGNAWKSRRELGNHTTPYYTIPDRRASHFWQQFRPSHRWWWCLQLSYNARPSCSTSHLLHLPNSLVYAACVHVCTLPPFHSPTSHSIPSLHLQPPRVSPTLSHSLHDARSRLLC